MIRRALVGVLGLATLGVGIAVLIDPALVPVSLSTAVVSFVGLAPLVLAYRVLVRRYASPRERARTGDPERAAVTDPPGRDYRETITDFVDARYAPTQRGLRTIAAAALDRYADDTAETLDRGNWTDDPYAVTLFAEDRSPNVSPLTRLYDRIHPKSHYRRQLDRAADAVAAVAGVDAPPEPSIAEQWLARLRAFRDAVDRERTGDRGELHPGGRRAVHADARTAEAAADGAAVSVASPTGAREVSEADADGESYQSEPSRETGHLRGVGVVALVAVGVGALYRQPAVLLAGVVGVGVAAAVRAATPPSPVLAVERTIRPARPEPGDRVDVTVTVRNEGDRTVPDLRLIDGVPPGVPVLDGSARTGAVLRPGASVTLSYAVEARRGEHTFEPLLAIARDVTGSYESLTRASEPTTLTCTERFDAPRAPLPLRRRTATASPGPIPTGGGEGVEFHATREYRRGDPPSRIDWNRRARTGALATLTFREERAAKVALVIDARAPAYVASEPTAHHAVDRSVSAAGDLAVGLLDAGNRVGLAALAPTDCWLAPAAGSDHRVRLREMLNTHPAFGPTPPTEPVEPGQWVEWLQHRLSSSTQIFLCSPVADSPPVEIARALDARGHPVTVVSPDSTADRTPPQRLARAARRMRVDDLRRTGIPVVDWHGAESLAVALTRTERRRSR